MPNKVLNGDFEATAVPQGFTGSQNVPFWTWISGSINATTLITPIQGAFAGNATLKLPNSFCIKQTFPTPIKAGQFSFWTSNSSTGNYQLTYNDDTIDTITIPPTNPFVKVQKLFSPAKYIKSIQFNNTSSGAIYIDEVQLWEESLPIEVTDQPKISAHVFRGVHPESEDSFTRGAISDGSGSASTDGDVLTLYLTGSTNWVRYDITTANYINTQIYKTLVTRLKGNTTFSIALTSGSSQFTIANTLNAPSDFTVQTYDISTSGFINKIQLYTLSGSLPFGFGQGPGDGSQFVKYDYVFFTTGSYIDITNDLITGQVKRGALEAGTFNFELRNDNAKYISGSNKINYWDNILIYGGYKNNTDSIINYKKLSGGKIEQFQPQINSSRGNTIEISGRDNISGLINILAFGSYGGTGSLFPPPGSPGIGGIHGNGVNPNIGEIGRDLVDRFVNGTPYGFTTGYRIPVDITGSGLGNSANTIGGYSQWLTGSQVYYYEVRQRPVWDGLKETAEIFWAQQQTGSGLIIGDTPIQSLAYYMSPAGALHFEQIAQATIQGRRFGKTLSVGDNILDIKPSNDINNMKNLIDYFSIYWTPSDGDSWTEGTAAGWEGIVNGSLVSATNDSVSMYGSKCVTISGRVKTDDFLEMDYPKDASINLDFTKFGTPISPPYLSFWHRVHATGSPGNPNGELSGYALTVTCNSPGGGAKIYRVNGWKTGSSLSEATQGQLNFSCGPNVWNYTSIPIGPYAPSGSRENQSVAVIFLKTGSLEVWNELIAGANWSNVDNIEFDFALDNVIFQDAWASGSIDGLHIEATYRTIAEDTTSINKYGLREEFVTDPLIRDTGSASLLAKAELFKFRVPVTRGTIKTIFYPTIDIEQLVTVNYPDGGIYNQDFRIIRVDHNFSAGGFTSSLDISSDTGSQTPQSRADMINYILKSAGLSSRSATDLMNAPFDPFMVANTYNYPS